MSDAAAPAGEPAPASERAPADETAIIAAIAAASAAREPILLCGNGTKFGMLRPVQAARCLTTTNLTGITLYSPKELIISARAGTPLPEIEAALAENGQHLIAEPPDLTTLLGGAGATANASPQTIGDAQAKNGPPPNAGPQITSVPRANAGPKPTEVPRVNAGAQTIGGIVASNLSGPRRVAWGAMRDHVMGVRAVNGSGELIHSGGRVLKNVTGLDLCKLLTGSHGTLAVITEVTLKVLPAPESTGTLVLPGLGAPRGVAALSAGLGSPYGVSAAAWLPDASLVPALGGASGSATLLRIEDFPPSVAYRTARLRAELASFANAEILNDTTSRAVWRAVGSALPLPAPPSAAVWRVSVRPSAGPAVLRAVADAGVQGFLDWGGGLVWLAGPADTNTHRVVEQAARAAHGTWTLLSAPDALRVAVDVVPPEAEPLARITRRVKAAFDPHGILNPGRLYAGL
jgi:glycolate oxidase FAD binding subunit